MDNGRLGKNLRVGDTERESAIKLLGEHLTAGRLDIAEYDERCREAAAARFAVELNSLFDDLPAPRPDLVPPVPAAPRTPARPAAGTIIMVVCAAALFIFLLVTARQLALVLLLPMVAIGWLTWRRS